MGGLISAIKELFGKEERRILILGIDGAGKTTFLYKLKMGHVINTVPTIGFNVETIQYRNIKFNAWDVGGQDKIRKLWRYYYEGNDALIFVIDSNDRERIEEAALELELLLREEKLYDSAFLILANKQELPNAIGVSELTQILGLHKIRNRQWHIQPCCSISGEGLTEAMEWMSCAIKKKQK